MVLSKAIKKTERHNEATIMPSFAPVGYSSSSESLSRASASWIGVVSIIFFSASRLEILLLSDEEREGIAVISFSLLPVTEVLSFEGKAEETSCDSVMLLSILQKLDLKERCNYGARRVANCQEHTNRQIITGHRKG